MGTACSCPPPVEFETGRQQKWRRAADDWKDHGFTDFDFGVGVASSRNPERTTSRKPLNARSSTFDLWCMHGCNEVWMLTDVPNHAANNMPYDMRGWTIGGQMVAQLQP